MPTIKMEKPPTNLGKYGGNKYKAVYENLDEITEELAIHLTFDNNRERNSAVISIREQLTRRKILNKFVVYNDPDDKLGVWITLKRESVLSK